MWVITTTWPYFFKVYRGGEEQTGGDEEAVKFDFIEFGFTQ